MSWSESAMSPPHPVGVVNGDRALATEENDKDRQTNGGLGGGDRQDEHGEDLAGQIAEFNPTVILASTDDPAQLFLEAALQAPETRVVYLVRTTLALPFGPEGAFSETTAYAPNSPYSASKAAADHLVRAYHETYGLPTLLTNCSNNYGPYQFPEKLIPLMILNALDGKALPIYGDGGNVRDWLFVEDHCEGVLRVLRGGRPGER